MSKTHYAELALGNEANPHDEWSTTLCGLEYTESPLSNQIKHVDCKTCIKRYPKFEQQMTEYYQTEFRLGEKAYPDNFLSVRGLT